jgi:hypothetical protein
MHFVFECKDVKYILISAKGDNYRPCWLNVFICTIEGPF